MASSTSNKLTSFFFCFIAFQSAFSLWTEALVIESSQREPLNASINTGTYYIQESNSVLKRDLTYGQAVDDGNRYFCLLENPAVTRGQSLVTVEGNIIDSGWGRTIQRVQPIILRNLQNAFDKAKITVLPKDCACVSWEHTERKKNSANQWIPATKARYANIYNAKAGVIIAQANFGPDFMVSTKPVKLVPDVRKWSDIVFVEWQTQAAASNQDIKNLKYLIQYDIVSDDTSQIIDQAVGSQNLPWPGVVVPMTQTDGQPNNAGRAILGTPNGVGVAYLLSTHKAQLGHRLIESVSVWIWKKQKKTYLMAMFEIGEEIPTD